MRTDLWVIWVSLLVLVGALGGSIGSRYLPSQDRLDAEHEAGYLLGRGDEAREWERELAAGEPSQPWPVTHGEAQWNDTVENLRALAGPHYEPLARGAGDPPIAGYNSTSCSGDLVTKHHDPLKGDSPVPRPGPDPLFDALDDTGAFALISFELKYLKVLAAEPFGLTPWRTR